MKEICNDLAMEYEELDNIVSSLDESGWMREQQLDPVVDKIRKIINKAHCASATEKEAELFLQKAQELMVKYNLSQSELAARDRLFLRRPVGKLYRKMPSYIFAVCRLLEEHYFVCYIKNHVCRTEIRNGLEHAVYAHYIELFGDGSVCLFHLTTAGTLSLIRGEVMKDVMTRKMLRKRSWTSLTRLPGTAPLFGLWFQPLVGL